ncbi:hypothetical protein Tco_0924696 [Tanacetum coccineum]|uniref:Uncharacterized protein n=1 Tax=Tanacetum coccineum TaxID=301880 RepID=A0ABQ5D7E4_9ASTR
MNFSYSSHLHLPQPKSTLNSTNASSSNSSKKIKLTIIPPKQLFINISSDEDVTTTPSPTTTSSSPTPPNEPSKTPSTNQTSSSQDNTSSSFQSKLPISPPSLNEPSSPQPLNPLLENILDVPPRPLNPQPLQSLPSLDITLSLSPITPLDNLSSPPPPSPPPPQPPIMGHPLYYNYHDYHGSTCIDSILNQNIQSHNLVDVPVSIAAETPSSKTTTPQPPIPNTQPLQQTPDSTTTTIPTMTLLDIPNFASLFQFDQRVSTLETELSDLKQTNQFAKAVSSILGIVDKYLASNMKEAVDVAVQLQSKKLREEAQAEKQEFFNQIDSTMKTIIKGAGQTFRRISIKHWSNRTTVTKTSFPHMVMLLHLKEDEMINTRMKTLPLDQTEGQRKGDQAKKLSHQKNQNIRSPSPQFLQKVHPDLNQNLQARLLDDSEEQPHKGFNTGNDDATPVREVLNDDEWHRNPSRPITRDREWHKTKTIDNRPPQPWITQMAQAAGTQSSFNEFLATPINFSTFIKNRLKITNLSQEVLTGPKPMGIYKRHVAEDESSHDVYFKHMIIAVTSLKIMKWFGYSHPEEIIVRRQDDQLYKFREGDFKRLRRQDIEDMLLLLVQDKLTNLNLEERFVLNVALRMFTRRIVIQERVEDLQLGVKSYQKKLNLTKPDTYRSDLRRMIAYTAYPDIQGIIYKDEMNRIRLMRIDELHKFSDGTLNYVRTALNDIDLGIEMDYLPKRNWSKQYKQRACVMINAIDKKLRDRRLMRSLEKFVGGRPYGGDLRLLERTI